MMKPKMFDWREVRLHSQTIIEVFALNGSKRIFKWGPGNLFGPLPDSVLAQMTENRLGDLRERMRQLDGLAHLIAPLTEQENKDDETETEDIEVEYV